MRLIKLTSSNSTTMSKGGHLLIDEADGASRDGIGVLLLLILEVILPEDGSVEDLLVVDGSVALEREIISDTVIVLLSIEPLVVATVEYTTILRRVADELVGIGALKPGIRAGGTREDGSSSVVKQSAPSDLLGNKLQFN